jgi:branched-chain amino acid aminotransferase
VFETMVAVEDRVFRLDDHLARLLEGASVLELPLPAPSDLAWAVRETLRRNGLPRSVARLTATRGVDPGRGLALPAQSTPTVVVRVTPRERLNSESGGRGIGLSIWVASLRRNETSPISRVKTLAYTEGIVARLGAQRAGADDALLLNTQGNVACATSSNIFVVRSDRAVVTPPTSDGALPGVARRTVLELARHLGHVTAEESISPADVMQAEEVFLTNVVTGPVPVISVDGHPVGTGVSGEVSRALATSYAAAVEG